LWNEYIHSADGGHPDFDCMPMKLSLINEALKVLRLYWGKSQASLAAELGISQPYLSEVEAGRKDATLELLQRYSDVLKVPMSRLLFFVEEMEGAPKPTHGRVFIAGRALDLLRALVPEDAE
jgi:transcriptional regulator with XRE-family HTH domain